MDVNTDKDPCLYPLIRPALESQPRTILPVTQLQPDQYLLTTIRENELDPSTGLHGRGNGLLVVLTVNHVYIQT